MRGAHALLRALNLQLDKRDISFVPLAVALCYQRNCDYWSNEKPNNLQPFISLVQCGVSETQTVMCTANRSLNEFFAVSWSCKCSTLRTRQYPLPGVNPPSNC